MSLLAARTAYSRAEILSDRVIHISGVIVALISVPVLLFVTAHRRGDFLALFGISVYSATLLAMILCSALYNLMGEGRWSWLLRRLDHAAIFAKIAGTYTPFMLLTGDGAPWLLTGLWGAALTGIGLKAASPEKFHRLAICLYLAMGWAGLLAGGAFLTVLSTPVLVLILLGGGLYTLGVAFYLFDRLPFHYTIWHFLVLTATMMIYSAVTLQVVQTA